MSDQTGNTSFERHVRSQPDELERLLRDGRAREQAHEAAEGLHRVRRIWVVGTGGGQHAAALGAAMLQDAGRSAHSVSSMQFVRNAPIVGGSDGVIVIMNTGDSAYALAARVLAVTAGLQTVTIAHWGSPLNDVLETGEIETSETSSVGYTSAVLALGMIAAQMGADSITTDALALVPAAVRDAVDSPGVDAIPVPERSLAILGAGPAAITAAEAALKVRAAARLLAIGFDAEYFLHGSQAPLGPHDHVVALTTPDEDGFVGALADTAAATGIGVSRVAEPAGLPVLLAQIPLAVRMQMLALRFAMARGADPDVVATGAWASSAAWQIGAPVAGR